VRVETAIPTSFSNLKLRLQIESFLSVLAATFLPVLFTSLWLYVNTQLPTADATD